jgi:ATPase subunit of ABC transporter with duplicated ATPase domains
MDALRTPEGDDTPGLVLSGGERRVAFMPFVIATARRVIMDEPTNHLDAESLVLC